MERREPLTLIFVIQASTVLTRCSLQLTPLISAKQATTAREEPVHRHLTTSGPVTSARKVTTVQSRVHLKQPALRVLFWAPQEGLLLISVLSVLQDNIATMWVWKRLVDRALKVTIAPPR